MGSGCASATFSAICPNSHGLHCFNSLAQTSFLFYCCISRASSSSPPPPSPPPLNRPPSTAPLHRDPPNMQEPLGGHKLQDVKLGLGVTERLTSQQGAGRGTEATLPELASTKLAPLLAHGLSCRNVLIGA